jgi:hypothetical protein
VYVESARSVGGFGDHEATGRNRRRCAETVPVHRCPGSPLDGMNVPCRQRKLGGWARQPRLIMEARPRLADLCHCDTRTKHSDPFAMLVDFGWIRPMSGTRRRNVGTR